jgi:hypothetical protein
VFGQKRGAVYMLVGIKVTSRMHLVYLKLIAELGTFMAHGLAEKPHIPLGWFLSVQVFWETRGQGKSDQGHSEAVG